MPPPVAVDPLAAEVEAWLGALSNERRFLGLPALTMAGLNALAPAPAKGERGEMAALRWLKDEFRLVRDLKTPVRL